MNKENREKIIKDFQKEVSKIDTHYLNLCIESGRTLIGKIFEKYLDQILELQNKK